MAQKSDKVEELGFQLDALDAGVWEREYLFANRRNLMVCPTFMTEFGVPKPRLYRFDFALPSCMIAVEYEGGVGRGDVGHTSINAIKRDIEKNRLAALLGWTVIRVTYDDITGGEAMAYAGHAIELRRWIAGPMIHFYDPILAHSLLLRNLAVPWEGTS